MNYTYKKNPPTVPVPKYVDRPLENGDKTLLLHLPSSSSDYDDLEGGSWGGGGGRVGDDAIPIGSLDII